MSEEPNWMLSITRVAMLVLVFGIVAAGILVYEIMNEPEQPVVPQPGQVTDATGGTRAPLAGPSSVKQGAREVAAWVWFLVAVAVAALAAWVLWNIRYLAHRFIFAEHFLRPMVGEWTTEDFAERVFHGHGPFGHDPDLQERVSKVVIDGLVGGDRAKADAVSELEQIRTEVEALDTFTNNMFSRSVITRLRGDGGRQARRVAEWFVKKHLSSPNSDDDILAREDLARMRFSVDEGTGLMQVWLGDKRIASDIKGESDLKHAIERGML